MIKIRIDNINCTIEGPIPLSIENKFNVYVPGYKYMWEYKAKKWNGKQKLLENNTFQTGLLAKVITALHKERLQFELIDNRSINNPTIQASKIELRDYQSEAVTKALSNQLHNSWFPRGTIKFSTGGGKTRAAATIIDMVKVPTVFLTHKIDLVQQTKDRLLELNIKSGIVASGEKDLKQRVTIGTIQSFLGFSKKFDKNKFFAKFIEDIDNPHDYELEEANEKWKAKLEKNAKDQKIIEKFFNRIEMVIIDEAHLLCANKDSAGLFLKALNMMPNAYIRIGLTATPKMDNDFSGLVAEGATGGLLCDYGNQELTEQGYLSKVQVIMHSIPKVGKVPNKWIDCYDIGVVTHKARNQKIIDEALSSPAPVLVLVSKVNHGCLLQELARAKGFDIPFLFGEATLEERLDIAAGLISGSTKCAIASTIWDEGIDIPNIQTIILAGGGKSSIKNLQRVGRGMRTADNKTGLKVIDFYDKQHATLFKHSKIRERLWLDQGFEVKVIA